MASPPVFTIAPNPHWVVIDDFSKLPNGAVIYTYRSLDPSTFKAAFRDPAGMDPFTQPIMGFGNGTFPPIYWEFDPSNPNDTYYIQVWSGVQGTSGAAMLWDFNGLSGNSGGGGGGNITIFSDLINLVTNGEFYRNIGSQATLSTAMTIAPSNNAGLVNDPSNSNVTANGPVGPDIIFAKNNTNATDVLTFNNFTPLGIHALVGDVTPPQYLTYTCTGAGAGETYKYVQFPISLDVQNLSNQPLTVSIFARCTSGNTNATLSLRQFYGSGGAPSADQIVQIGAPLALTGSWQVFTFNINAPDATTKTLGACGNDALFLQFNYPLGVTTSIDIVKPKVYLGTITGSLSFDYDSCDSIDSIISLPRTGDVRTTLNAFQPGWVQMNDGTIGNKDGGGDSLATARDNNDTFPLFDLIWNTFNANQTLAPMFTSAGAPTTYGASSQADFTAYRQLSLTRNLGRVMAGSNPVAVSQAFTNVGNVMTVTSTTSFITGVPVVVSGGGLPTPLVAGTTYYAIMLSSTTMSLASSPENAIAGTPIVLTSNASGTVTVPANVLGSFLGEQKHLQTMAELAAHNHTYNVMVAGGTFLQGGPGGQLSSTPTGITGSSTPFNVMQPTVFMNVFIKL